MLIGAEAYLADGFIRFCESKEEGCLLQIELESVEVSMAYVLKVCIVAHDGNSWYINPKREDARSIWVFQ